MAVSNALLRGVYLLQAEFLILYGDAQILTHPNAHRVAWMDPVIGPK